MAIVAFDSKTDSNQGAASSHSFSHTIAAGENRAAFLAATILGSTTIVTITSATFAGRNMTLGYSRSNELFQLEIWYITNPPVGSNSLSLTFSSGTEGVKRLTAMSFTGIEPDSPRRNTNFFATFPSGTLNGVTSVNTFNDLVINICSKNSIVEPATSGGDQTIVTQVNDTSFDHNVGYVLGVNNANSQWNWSTSCQALGISATFIPFSRINKLTATSYRRYGYGL